MTPRSGEVLYLLYEGAKWYRSSARTSSRGTILALGDATNLKESSIEVQIALKSVHQLIEFSRLMLVGFAWSSI